MRAALVLKCGWAGGVKVDGGIGTVANESDLIQPRRCRCRGEKVLEVAVLGSEPIARRERLQRPPVNGKAARVMPAWAIDRCVISANGRYFELKARIENVEQQGD